MTRRSASVRVWGPPLALLATAVVMWELAVRALGTPAYILPAPTQVVAAAGEVAELLPDHILTTMTEALLGIISGAIIGVGLAVAIWSSALVRRVLYPVLVGSQTVPMIVLAPLLVLWFGLGLTPKVVVVALITVFPVAVSTVSGLESADPEQLDLLRSMGADRRDIMRIILVPTALPGFFAGLRIAAAYAVAGAVIAEWVGASRGLGLFITRSQASFRVDRVFVGVIVIAALSVLLFLVVHALARMASPWRFVSDDSTAATRTVRPDVSDTGVPRT